MWMHLLSKSPWQKTRDTISLLTKLSTEDEVSFLILYLVNVALIHRTLRTRMNFLNLNVMRYQPDVAFFTENFIFHRIFVCYTICQQSFQKTN